MATDKGIDRESETAADLRIGPTTLGMVRIYIAGGGIDLPLDFEPDEADEIAEELRAAAAAARAMARTVRGRKGEKGEKGEKGGRGGDNGSPKGGRG